MKRDHGPHGLGDLAHPKGGYQCSARAPHCIARQARLRRLVARLHLDALVPRIIYRAQRHGGRVERVPDLYCPLAGV